MEKYVHIKKIGEGSFGKALLVKRKDDGKQCVVKQISISRMSSKEKEESRKEVLLLAKLKHPNIVTYLESFEGSGNLYIVMDYCEGGDVYQLITRQRGIHMDEAKVLDIFVQSCLAIKHIHDRKVLHRDIKTQNIFLTKHHIVKLGDFGIARVLKNTMELARTCIGTPYYLSPEIVENRPYNNKSDIWSLGCVLYELATLKHAFEAGNMKNLVLKICRGSYPPVPNKYSFELRSMVAHCFKRSPTERPSINTLLKKPIIQQRISKFLSPENIQEEFSHTVIHRAPKANPVSRPFSAAPKNIPAGKRQGDLVSVYGVSVAKKPAVRKPLAAVNAVVKPRSASGQGAAKNSGKRMADARERRRKEILSQEDQYQAHVKKVQKQRHEKQQAAHIGRAREEGWKNILGTDEKDKMKKYQPKVEDKIVVNKKFVAQPEEKPGIGKPLHAWSNEEQNAQRKDLKNEKKDCREEKERARMLDEFWQRKNEAAANKARGVEAAAGGPNPILQLHEERMRQKNRIPDKPPIHPAARNGPEAEYLKQLEQIRRQNYNERKAIRGSHQESNSPPQQSEVAGGGCDPRFDVDARRKKIQALKVQADRRAGMLKEQLERRRRQVQERVEKDRIERMQKWNNDRESFQHQQQQQPQKQMKPMAKKEVIQPKDFAVPSVGIATAMKEVIQPKMFRSLSEGEIQNLVKPKPKDGVRKMWGGNPKEPMAFANIPLEITASAMEATRVIEPAKQNSAHEAAHRKGWNEQGKTQLVSMLHNFDLIGTQMPTMTIKGSSDGDSGSDKTIQSSSETKDPPKQLGETIVISKTPPKTNVGETITLSGKPTTKNLPIINQDSSKTIVLSTNQKADNGILTSQKAEKDSTKQTDNTNVVDEKVLVKQDDKKGEEGLEVIALDGDTSMTSDVASHVTVKNAWTDKDGCTSLVKSSSSKEEAKTPQKTPEKAAIGAITDDNNEEQVENNNNNVNDSDNDESFHTPNRTFGFGLQLGSYDVQQKEANKMLRTCSLPDLRPPVIEEDDSTENEGVEDEEAQKSLDSLTAGEHKTGEHEESDRENTKTNGEADLEIKDLEENDDGDNDEEENKGDNDDEDEGDNDDEDEGDNDDEDEGESDEEEYEDYESMLESMRNVLGKTSVPTSTEGTLKEATGVEKKETGNEEDDDDDEWEEEDYSGDSATTSTTKEKAMTLKDDRDNLFSRIEESRKRLEDELGMDLFIKVYRHVQMMQDNEDDALEVGTTDISELLGDKENLYQKVLYLVIADSAYSEGNDGTF